MPPIISNEQLKLIKDSGLVFVAVIFGGVLIGLFATGHVANWQMALVLAAALLIAALASL